VRGVPVNALDNDHNLLPRPVRSRLALNDGLLEHSLKMLRVVMLEHLDRGAAASNSDHNRSMVQRVADNQRSLISKGRRPVKGGSSATP